jgi:hypothetical protein
MLKSTFKVLLIAYLSIVVLPFPTYAADDQNAWDALNEARGLKCDFGPGISTEWRGDEPNSEDTRITAQVYLNDIDFQAGKARLMGSEGAIDVSTQLSPMTVNFVGMSGMWNMSIITVYPYYLKGTENFPAVWSRHQYLADGPLASQFYGACIVAE